jgi:hypothetical protein
VIVIRGSWVQSVPLTFVFPYSWNWLDSERFWADLLRSVWNCSNLLRSGGSRESTGDSWTRSWWLGKKEPWLCRKCGIQRLRAWLRQRRGTKATARGRKGYWGQTVCPVQQRLERSKLWKKSWFLCEWLLVNHTTGEKCGCHLLLIPIAIIEPNFGGFDFKMGGAEG